MGNSGLIQETSLDFHSLSSLGVIFSLSTVPDHAHFLCQDFESAVRLAAEPPLADLIETIWVVGGMQVYKVKLSSSTLKSIER